MAQTDAMDAIEYMVTAPVAKPDLGSRLAHVFGALGGSGIGSGSGSAPAWELQSNVKPFNIGSRSIDAYSSDEENEAAAPKPLMPASMMDSDAEEEDAEEGEGFKDGSARRDKPPSSCDAHLRLAFEAEEEEDVFDTFAVSTYRIEGSRKLEKMVAQCGDGDSRPDGAMEVLDDNPFDRMCALRQAPLPEPSSFGGFPYDAIKPARQVGAVDADASPAPTSWAARMLAVAATKSGSDAPSSTDGSATGTSTSPAACPEASSSNGGGTQCSKHRALGAASSQPKAKRRVRFTVAKGDGAGDTQPSTCGKSSMDVDKQHEGPRAQGGSQQAARPQDVYARPGRGGGSGRGRNGGPRALNWQRAGFVPDHVKNPDRYTVYTFDEPVVVGSDRHPGRMSARQPAPDKELLRAQVIEEPTQAAPVTAAVPSADYQLGEEGERDTMHEPERAPIAFGTGAVKFSRRSGSSTHSGHGSGGPESTGLAKATGAGPTAIASSLVDESGADSGMGAEDVSRVDAAEEGPQAPTRTTRRKFRVKHAEE